MTTRIVEVTSGSYGRAFADLKGTPVGKILNDFDEQARSIFGNRGSSVICYQADTILRETCSKFPDIANPGKVLKVLLQPARRRVASAKSFDLKLAAEASKRMMVAERRIHAKLKARAALSEATPA